MNYVLVPNPERSERRHVQAKKARKLEIFFQYLYCKAEQLT